jgi:uncharacterized protein YndB with AHSA1/START domain
LKTVIEVTTEVEVAAPPSEVWAVLSDPGHWPEWVEEWESAQLEPEGPAQAGTVVRYTLKPGHRSGTLELVEWEPEVRLAWDGSPLTWLGGGARPRGSIELAQTHDGRTRITTHFRPELSGAQVLLRPYLKRWLRRQREADARKLKALLEGGLQ